jgi:hypothetical protein
VRLLWAGQISDGALVGVRHVNDDTMMGRYWSGWLELSSVSVLGGD